MDIIGDNGLSIVGGKLYPGFETPPAPEGAVLIGTDAAGNNWCYVQRLQTARVVISNANNTSAPQQITYSVSSGSTIGFSQKFGVSVEVIAGISFLINVSAKVQISGEIGFSQAFSKLESTEITAQTAPGVKTTIYQGTIVMSYYKLSNDYTGYQNYCTQTWENMSTDVVETNAYETTETPLPTLTDLKAMV